MQGKVAKLIKKIVLQILPDSHGLRYLSYRPKLVTWCKKHSGPYPIFDERTEMYDFINKEILSSCAILYLEFGVFKGESIKYFANINSNSDSIFIGFDTFTGLPNDWLTFTRTVKSNTFDTGGEIPQLEDPRINFYKGLFQDTLPIFLNEYKSGKQLVIHNDSDLYSATLFMLTYANKIITPGTIIIFDEFYSVLDEFRALEDYCESYMRSYEVVAATRDHKRITIKMK
jgi:O-methyltransferase